MMENDTEHLNDLIEEIDILIGLLDYPIEEDPIREEDTILKSKLKNKEYKELLVYNSKSPSEKVQKDFKHGGEFFCIIMSDKIYYDNQTVALCESGGLVGNKSEIKGRGVKVTRESSKEGKGIPLLFKKSKIIKIWIDEASRDGW